MPPRTMLEDPNLVASPEMQSTFNDVMHKGAIGKCCVELGKWGAAIKAGMSLGFGKDSLQQLTNLRYHGKRCCGVHAMLMSITGDALPKDTSKLSEHAKGIDGRLRKKGIGPGEGQVPLPEAFQKVLDELKQFEAPAA